MERNWSLWDAAVVCTAASMFAATACKIITNISNACAKSKERYEVTVRPVTKSKKKSKK